jgi:hypothetical protein
MRRRTIAVSGAGLIILLLLLWWHAPGSRRKVHRKATAAARPVAATVGFSPRSLGEVAAQPIEGTAEILRPPSVVMGRPILTGVDIEPQPACLGQPVVVKMRGGDPDGRDNEVIYEAWGHTGNPVVYTPEVEGKVPVLVAAYNLRGDYDQRSIDIEVHRCGPDEAPLAVRLLNAGPVGVAGLQAILPKRFAGTPGWTYEWDFGDGPPGSDIQTTTVPYVEHDYRDRDQRRYMSSYVVKVRATRGTDSVEGEVSVPFTNLYAINRMLKHMIVPDVQLDHVAISDQQLTALLTVRQWEDQPLVLHDVAVHMTSCSDGEASDMATGSVTLSRMTFPPGASKVTMTATVPARTCAVLVEVTGEYTDGSQIFLQLSAPVPGAAPDATRAAGERSKIVANTPETQATFARLAAAARLLGKKPGEPLDPEDVQRLDAEGKLPPRYVPPPPPAEDPR